jgi:endonuclease/exonuclease/phosphatase (EEP) superfamily protein YafD
MPELWHSDQLLRVNLTNISRTFVTCVIVCASLATLIAELEKWFWIGSLLESFRTQYVLLFGATLIGALLLRRPALATAAVVGLGWNLFPVVQQLRGDEALSGTPAASVRILSFNIAQWNEDVVAITDMLKRSAADVVVLMEVPEHRGKDISELLPEFPHTHLEGGGILNGAIVYSRWPIRNRNSLPIGIDGARTTIAEIDIHGQSLTLYATHLHWPTSPSLVRSRDMELNDLASHVRGCLSGCVVVGDLNISTWSSKFKEFISAAGLHDCAHGKGLLPTWPSQLWWPLRIRIDHCLASKDVRVIGVATGPAAGSDHLPTINDLDLGARFE